MKIGMLKAQADAAREAHDQAWHEVVVAKNTALYAGDPDVRARGMVDWNTAWLSYCAARRQYYYVDDLHKAAQKLARERRTEQKVRRSVVSRYVLSPERIAAEESHPSDWYLNPGRAPLAPRL